MHVAALELCRELHQVAPDWTDTDYSWFIDDMVPDDQLLGLERAEPSIGARGSRISTVYSEVPAYDLGFLMRKVPNGYGLIKGVGGRWVAFDLITLQSHNGERNDTPEDAVVMLCIKLWRQGALAKEMV